MSLSDNDSLLPRGAERDFSRVCSIALLLSLFIFYYFFSFKLAWKPWRKNFSLINSLFYNSKVVAQSCPTLCNPMDCRLPGSSVHGIFQAIVLEWIAISFSRGSSRPRAGFYFMRLFSLGYSMKRSLVGTMTFRTFAPCRAINKKAISIWIVLKLDKI